MNVQHEQLKNLMVRDKLFLKELYEGNDIEQKKRILNFASDSKLNTLIKFLHFLTNGDIKIKKENFESIPSKNIKFLKQKVEKKTSVAKLLKSERSVKLKILKSQVTIFKFLLYCLFNEI